MSALANNADDFGFAFPAIATMAADSRCDEKTVKRALRALEQTGWLYIARKVINGKGNCYILNAARLGVRVSPESKRSPVFTRLLKLYGDTMTPIFAPEKSGDMDTFSGDNPQPLQGTSARTQGTFQGGSGGIAGPPNRNNRHSLNRKGTVSGVGPTPLPPKGGEHEVADTLPEQTGGRGESPEPGGVADGAAPPTPLHAGERGASPHLVAAWDRMRLSLKQDVGATLRANYSEIIPGTGDFDACFRDWWFLGIERTGMRFEILTHSANEALTERGLRKYRDRVEALIRYHFRIQANAEIVFTVRKPDQQTSSSAAA